jgi:hypothetical protein
MYELIRRLSLRQLAAEQLPVFLAALAIAETFYKFKSFLLETAAFLVTWYVLGAVVAGVKALAAPAKAESSR